MILKGNQFLTWPTNYNSDHALQGFHYVYVHKVSGVLQPGTSSFSFERKKEKKTKTAGQLARCPALNEPPGSLRVFEITH